MEFLLPPRDRLEQAMTARTNEPRGLATMVSQTSFSGINASGRIVGGHSYTIGSVAPNQYAYTFVYAGGIFTNVADPNSGAGVTGINEAGQVVGLFSDSTGTHGFLNTGGTLTTVDDPDATVSNGTSATEAYGINNAGQIVGIFLGPGYWNGFLDTNGTFTTITDPSAYFNPGPGGGFTGGGTFATGINNNGQIVGYYFDVTGTRFGYVDTSGTFTMIGDPLAAVGTFGSGTVANGINDAGDVVGSYFDASGGQHGFVDTDGVYTTIDVPGAIATTAAGINGSGVIVGTWYGSNNLGHGFEATPIAPGGTIYNITKIDAPDTGGSLIPPPPTCFLAGTRIATTGGEIPVEQLIIGDTVRAHFAGSAAVCWIGHRRFDCRKHPKPETVWPVRVRAGAFGDERPHRDLWLSPNHAVFVDDVLIPIKYLRNGGTIAQVPIDEVTWYHVELPRHDLLLAEALLVESYLDTGDCSDLTNGDDVIRLFPEFTTRAADETYVLWAARGCAPLVVAGSRLDRVRQLVNSIATGMRRVAVRGHAQQR